MNTKAKGWQLCSHGDEGTARSHQPARKATPLTAGAALLEKWAGGRNPDTTPLQDMPLSRQRQQSHCVEKLKDPNPGTRGPARQEPFSESEC